MEEYTIKSLAEELNIEAKVVKNILGLKMTTNGATTLDQEQVQDVRASLVTAPPENEPVEDSQKVIFYWAKGQEYQFFIPVKGDLPNIFYKTEKSVLTLNPDIANDAKAIKILNGMRQNEKNGGSGFKQLDSLESAHDEVGKSIDDLMLLTIPTLAKMSGLGIEADRMSKGELIAQILKIEK